MSEKFWNGSPPKVERKMADFVDEGMFPFLLDDRLQKIRSINEQKDLEHNGYIAFSGGKDSVILSHLIDMALPDNKIPRVFSNTGLEFNDILKFVRKLAATDDRIVIVNQNRNIREVLESKGYPFKSKEYSLRVSQFNKGSNAKFIKKYIGLDDTYSSRKFLCPKILKYQFEDRGVYNYSDRCCYELKKALQHTWQKENKKKITITGMRNEEGGNRARLSCLTSGGTKFHPLIVCSSEWEDWFIREYNVELCRLYYPPFNFERTGCVGCPFNIELQKELDTLEKLLPSEKKKAELVFKPVYDEYRRIGYRLRKNPTKGFWESEDEKE